VSISKSVSKSNNSVVVPTHESVSNVVQIDVEPYITAKDVAERLHVKPSTVYEWTRRRSRDEAIPHYPLTRKVLLFRWSEVSRWVETKKVA